MLSDKMQEALNDQLNFELYSSYIYMAMAAWSDDQDLPGCANWFYIQAKEELTHAEKFFRYVQERDGRVLLAAIDQPGTAWDSPVAAFEETLSHEREVSRRIYELVDLATEERDHATNNFLQWFVAEQVEEEASAKEILQKVRLVSASPGGMYMVDRELAQRVFATGPDDE